MPYKSEAQRGKFHALEDRGEISHATVKEFDKASKGKDLPTKVSDKKGAGPVMHAALPHACCGKPVGMHKGAGPQQNFVKQVLGKQMAKTNATMLANMGAPKKKAGY